MEEYVYDFKYEQYIGDIRDANDRVKELANDEILTIKEALKYFMDNHPILEKNPRLHRMCFNLIDLIEMARQYRSHLYNKDK